MVDYLKIMFIKFAEECIEILKKLEYEYIYRDIHMEGEIIYTEYNTNFEYVDMDKLYELEDIIPERKKKHGMIYVK